MKRSPREGHLAAVMVCALAACGPLSEDELASVEQAERVNTDPDFVLVYNNNIENLETPKDRCKGDWKDLIHYMDRRALSPDLFLVQQVAGRGQLNRYTDFMSRKLRGRWAGVIADPNPPPFRSPCGPAKAHQTNAIIYRVGRFAPVGPKHTWKSWRKLGGKCKRDPVARTLNVMQKFRDEKSGKHVTAISLHWSTTQGCAQKNMVEAERKLHRPGYQADLFIVGGDMNEPDRRNGDWLPWYQRANGQRGGDLGFRDVIYAHCSKRSGLRRCLDDNWTVPSGRRIDFLLTKKGNGRMPKTTARHTITFGEADAAAVREVGGDSPYNYSDHRAIRARIWY